MGSVKRERLVLNTIHWSGRHRRRRRHCAWETDILQRCSSRRNRLCCERRVWARNKGRQSAIGEPREMLCLQFERLLCVNGRHWRRTVNGRCIDIGKSVEGGWRGGVDHSGNGSRGSQVGPARDGLDLEREPRSLWRGILMARHAVAAGTKRGEAGQVRYCKARQGGDDNEDVPRERFGFKIEWTTA